MRQFYLAILVILFVADSVRNFQPEYSIQIDDAAYEIGGREDLMGRNEYLQMLTSDPKTGQIPLNIGKAELAFSKKLESKPRRGRTEDALEFTSAGPNNVGGRTRAVAFDVRDENIILAGGVSGGMWKSTDGGLSWTRKSNPDTRNGVTCLVQDIRPGRENTWYYGTGEIVGNSTSGGNAPFRGGGIYKSLDNGESWSPLPSTQMGDPNVFNSQFQYIWNIEINPTNLVEDEILVAAFGGIIRSTDGGNSWETMLGRSLVDIDSTADLNRSNASFYTSLIRSEANIYYAALSTETPPRDSLGTLPPDAGFHISTNGSNWTEITPFTSESQFRRTVIGSSPSNPNVTYFFIDSSPFFILEHDLSLINSPDRVNGFDTEPRVVPSFDEDLGIVDTQGSYNMVIKVHPTDHNIVYLGATNLFRSTDAFRTEENISWIGGYNTEGGAGVYPNHHPDQHDLLFLPSDANVALSANDGGLRLTSNILADTVEWESRNNGFLTSQFFTIAQSKVAGDATTLGGMQDNGTDLSSTGNINWGGILGGDGGYSATTKDNTLWYASFQRGQTLRLTLNDDFGITSFGRVDPGSLVAQAGSLYLFVNPFALDPQNDNRAFFAGGNHLYFHPNVAQIPGGSQVPTALGWIRVNEAPAQNGLVSTVEVSRNSKKVYFGTSGGEIFRLDNADDQTQFTVVDITNNQLPERAYISSISVNPENEDHILVVFSSYNVPSIFESRDGGVTFADVSGNLEENPDGSGAGPSIRWGEIIPTNSGELYLVGTSIGLFSTTNFSGTSTNWTKESVDLIGSSVVTMMDYRASDGRLVIASHGNGVFATTIPDFKAIDQVFPAEESFDIVAAYPNPFNDQTNINFTIPEDDEVRIDIYTSSGALVTNLLWAPQFAGDNTVTWAGDTNSGTSLSNGVYFYRVQYRGDVKSGRLVLRR